jgi:hypothetical protein
LADDPATKKPTAAPAVRALIDEPELDDGALEGIVGGGGMVAAGGRGDAGDSWSQTIYDHGLPVGARDGPPVESPKQDADGQAPGASEVKRALLPGPATRALAPPNAPPNAPPEADYRSSSSPDLRSLFDPPDQPPDGN